jgi:uncharacterized NAD(P)/FAD-binding protein YdhS
VSAPYRVVIVGGGFAGTATAIALLRGWTAPRPLRLTLLERSADFGRGVAYATPDPQHLLNVRAGRMSAVAGRPDDLVEWAGATADSFLPRGLYGDYLRATLVAARREAPAGTVRQIADEAIRVVGGAPATVLTRDGERHLADAVVVAVGISRPQPPSGATAVTCHPAYVADPWDHARVAALAGAGEGLIIGTGLTMVDVALTLSTDPAGPPITAVSRHGLVPRAHRPDPSPHVPPAVVPGECRTADELAARVEEAARGGDWRATVDGLRPVTQELWRALPDAEKRRFAAHHARRWEVLRSRMAPQVAARIRELMAAGRLRVISGHVDGIEPLSHDRLAVTIRAGGVTPERRIVVGGVINSAGPAWDMRRGDSALVHALLDDGLAAPGPVGLGLRTAPDGTLLDGRGRAQSAILTLGALRRGELWETVSVPELREQAAAIAAALGSRAAAGAGRAA